MQHAVSRQGLLLIALALVCMSSSGRAADDDGFYKGKQITFVVGSGPGGGYDLYGRALATYIGEHIPDKPKVIVNNMVGASGLRAASYICNNAARDGTVIAITLSSIPTAPQLIPSGVNFDPATFSWIGSMTRDRLVGYVWNTSPIKTVADTLSTEAVMGADSLGASGAGTVVVAKSFFSMKLKLVLGYSNSTASKLAMEKGEVDGNFGDFYSNLQTTRPDWLRNGAVKLIVQHGRTRAPDLPAVPSIYEFVKNEEQRDALNLLLARQDFAKPVFAPPDVPPARLAILRRAFDATLKDPGFREFAAKTGLLIEEPMGGEELSATVSELARTPPQVSAHLRDLFANHK